MASWESLINANLEEAFNRNPEKEDKLVAKRRASLIAQIDAALEALNEGKDKGPRGLFTSQGGVTRATLKIGPKIVKIKAMEAVFVPRDKAAEFYSGVRADVERGTFDDAIATAFGDKAEVARAPAGSRWSY